MVQVLIADDDQHFLETTGEYLRRAGYTPHLCADAEEAVKKLIQQDIAVVIADIQMPGNADLELVRSLPKVAPDVPVILVTGYPTIDTAVESLGLSVHAYLMKPVELNDIARHVAEAIEHRETQRMIKRSRAQLEAWMTQLHDLERALLKPGTANSISVNDYVDITLSQVVTAIAGIRSFTQLIEKSRENQSICQLSNCPRLKTWHRETQNTIDVLEKTKGSFRSKELGALRRHLEDLLHVDETPPPQRIGSSPTVVRRRVKSSSQ